VVTLDQVPLALYSPEITKQLNPAVSTPRCDYSGTFRIFQNLPNGNSKNPAFTLNEMESDSKSEQMISPINLTAVGNDMNRHNELGWIYGVEHTPITDAELI
jgi:hypothetical protein